jgi:hypothetical protein
LLYGKQDFEKYKIEKKLCLKVFFQTKMFYYRWPYFFIPVVYIQGDKKEIFNSKILIGTQLAFSVVYGNAEKKTPLKPHKSPQIHIKHFSIHYITVNT